MYLFWFICGILGGTLIGIIIENSSARNHLKKSEAELRSKNDVISAMSRQIRQLRDDQF